MADQKQKISPNRVMALFISILILLIGITAIYEKGINNNNPLAQQGVIDLTDWKFDSGKPAMLRGEWAFYWKELLEPSSIGEKPSVFYPVPKVWKGPLGNDVLESQGYGTYRLKIKVPDGEAYYGIQTLNIRMASRIYVNGQLAAVSGQPAISRDSGYQTKNVPETILFWAKGPEIDLVIQVAEYYYFPGGIVQDIYFGSANAISRRSFTSSAMDVIIVVAFLITAIFYGLSRMKRGNDRTQLYFLGFSVLYAYIVATGNQKIFLKMFLDAPYELIYQTKFVVIYLCGIMINLFIGEIDKRLIPILFQKIVNTLYVILAMLSAVLPISLMGYVENVCYFLIAAQFLLTISFIILNIYGKGKSTLEQGELNMLLTLNSLIITNLIATLLYLNGVISTSIISFGSIFIFLYMNIRFVYDRNRRELMRLEQITEELIRADKLKDEFLVQLQASMKKAKDAEIAFLQAQVKPHFLFNTLNSIAALTKRQPAEAEKLTLDFAAYLRGSFDFKNLESLTTVDKEVQHLKHYLAIEQVRFGSRLQVEYDLEVEYNLPIPPLILQPIVENAVKHGISTLPQGGEVRISIRKTEEGLEFTVSDDGKGMTPARLEQIRSGETGEQIRSGESGEQIRSGETVEQMRSGEKTGRAAGKGAEKTVGTAVMTSEKKETDALEKITGEEKAMPMSEGAGIGMSAGIGIWNINKRLKDLYGTGLEIRSEEGKGTRVRFVIPG